MVRPYDSIHRCSSDGTLGGELAADPAGLFGQQDPIAEPAGRERGRDPAQAAADHRQVHRDLVQCRLLLCSVAGQGVRGLSRGALCGGLV